MRIDSGRAVSAIVFEMRTFRAHSNAASHNSIPDQDNTIHPNRISALLHTSSSLPPDLGGFLKPFTHRHSHEKPSRNLDSLIAVLDADQIGIFGG
jgi:hypothetical protein